jgi:hypothetical protein
MPILENYRTEAELAKELKHRCGFGEIRTLRKWRNQRTGPPWRKLGRVIIYPNGGFESWLSAGLQHPVRSRSGKSVA